MKKCFLLFLAILNILSCKKTPANQEPIPKDTDVRITFSATGPGVISPDGIKTVTIGTDVPYTVTPNLGASIVSITMDNTTVIPVNGSSYILPKVTSDHTITVVFAAVAVTSYTVTASSGPNGAVTPASVSVVSGGSVSLTFAPNAGFHTDSLWIDGVFSKTLGGVTTYTVSNVTANHAVKVSFSDALKASQLDALGNILAGSWHYIEVEQKAQGVGNGLPWQLQPIDSCEADDYEVYKTDSTYVSYLNGTSCVPFGPTNIDFNGKWNFSLNGQIVYFAGKHYLNDTHTVDFTFNMKIEKLTADSLVITFPGVYKVPAVITRRHYARDPAHH